MRKFDTLIRIVCAFWSSRSCPCLQVSGRMFFVPFQWSTNRFNRDPDCRLLACGALPCFASKSCQGSESIQIEDPAVQLRVSRFVFWFVWAKRSEQHRGGTAILQHPLSLSGNIWPETFKTVFSSLKSDFNFRFETSQNCLKMVHEHRRVKHCCLVVWISFLTTVPVRIQGSLTDKESGEGPWRESSSQQTLAALLKTGTRIKFALYMFRSLSSSHFPTKKTTTQVQHTYRCFILSTSPFYCYFPIQFL